MNVIKVNGWCDKGDGYYLKDKKDYYINMDKIDYYCFNDENTKVVLVFPNNTMIISTEVDKFKTEG